MHFVASPGDDASALMGIRVDRSLKGCLVQQGRIARRIKLIYRSFRPKGGIFMHFAANIRQDNIQTQQ
jgi:hypothetical protein